MHEGKCSNGIFEGYLRELFGEGKYILAKGMHVIAVDLPEAAFPGEVNVFL